MNPYSAAHETSARLHDIVTTTDLMDDCKQTILIAALTLQLRDLERRDQLIGWGYMSPSAMYACHLVPDTRNPTTSFCGLESDRLPASSDPKHPVHAFCPHCVRLVVREQLEELPPRPEFVVRPPLPTYPTLESVTALLDAS